MTLEEKEFESGYKRPADSDGENEDWGPKRWRRPVFWLVIFNCVSRDLSDDCMFDIPLISVHCELRASLRCVSTECIMLEEVDPATAALPAREKERTIRKEG